MTTHPGHPRQPPESDDLIPTTLSRDNISACATRDPESENATRAVGTSEGQFKDQCKGGVNSYHSFETHFLCILGVGCCAMVIYGL
ncbi:hypothetical protein Tco_1485333 [Tanacetum coccineum]